MAVRGIPTSLISVNGSLRGPAPASFALVMATGILSIAMRTDGWMPVSYALLAIAALAYLVLIVLSVMRIVRHRDAVRADAS